MIRDVDLVSYLPPFLREFRELHVALTAENPEFMFIWRAADQVLANEFIDTADEAGIARFEQMLGILPSKEDTLESRRSRVQARWFQTMPYTFKALLAKLAALSPDREFAVMQDADTYRLVVETSFILFGQVEELEHLLELMVPCNMVIQTFNRISIDAAETLLLGGVLIETQEIIIDTDWTETEVLSGNISSAGGISEHRKIVL